jgi:hypothetical protein
MANVNAPFGFKPLQSATGAASNFEMIQAPIAYNDTTPIYTGDPVKILNTGYVSQWTNGTAVSQLWGIFWGVTYLSSSQGKQVQNNYWPGTDVASTAQTSIVANIIPCTGAIPGTFLVQSDSTGVAFADIGQNCDVTLGTGSAYNGRSGAYISNLGTAATLPFRIIGLYGGLPGAGGYMGVQPSSTNPYGGSSTGAYNWVIVRANTSGAGATGI